MYMQKITSHLWYDKEAKEAAEFYTSVFPDSSIKNSSVLHNTPSGDVDIVTIQLMDHEFTLLSAGPLFKFTPAISYMVSCATVEEVDALWAKLSPGGTTLMELSEYPFSKRYGWTTDKYGLSWQLAAMGDQPIKQRITPALTYVGAVAGKAEEAMNFYTSVFHDSSIGFVMRYEAGEESDKAGTIKHASFMLEGQLFVAMDSAREHNFTFNEAISLMVHCKDQAEIDYYWKKLSAVPESEQCGWLKDKFGVSWQVVPDDMDAMMSNGTLEQIARVTEAFLKMKKFDLAELQKAYEGKE